MPSYTCAVPSNANSNTSGCHRRGRCSFSVDSTKTAYKYWQNFNCIFVNDDRRVASTNGWTAMWLIRLIHHRRWRFSFRVELLPSHTICSANGVNSLQLSKPSAMRPCNVHTARLSMVCCFYHKVEHMRYLVFLCAVFRFHFSQLNEPKPKP